MPVLEAERVGDTLWLGGNIVPSVERELQSQIETYFKSAPPEKRTIEMSAVRYLASSAARVLVQVVQDAQEEQGRKVKLLASIPVARTMSLLGGERWLEIEACQKPNNRPATEPPSGPPPPLVTVERKFNLPGSPSAARLPGARDSQTNTAPLPREATDSRAAAGGAPRERAMPPATGGEVRDYPSAARSPSYGQQSPGVGLNAPGSSVVAAVGGADQVVVTAMERAGMPLAADDEALPGSLAVLRRLIYMGTYTFHITATKNDVTGKVLGRVSGPWIIVDTHGARHMVNLEQVGCIDILA